MNYINKITNEYPVYEVHIKARGNGFDDYAMVYNSEIPQYDKATQMCVEVQPELINGTYFRRYVLKNKSAEQVAKEQKDSVPTVITPRQARLALLQATLLDELEALLVTNREMQIWWEYSLDIQRNHEHIITMGSALGLTEAQLDDLFILGATL